MPRVDLLSRHAGIRDQVTATLRAFLATQRETLLSISDELTPAIDELTRFVLDGGKRLRPAFTYWGFVGAGGSVEPDDTAIVTAAASLELVQACALIHDDVMDGSLTRRGNPAVHRHFAALHRADNGRGDADSHGEAMAILLGDFALVWADELLRSAGFSAKEMSLAWPIFERMRTELMAGQYLDLASQAYGELAIERARRVAVFKSGKYTIERPLHLGAALAGADEAVMRAYSAYGLPLGEAFQHRDDVLGVFGDPAQTGKPAGDDLREGKRTVLVALGLARATAAQAELLHRCLGDPLLSAEDVEQARGVLTETGALAELEAMISRLTEQASTALADAGRNGVLTGEGVEALTALVAATTARSA